MSFLDFCLFNVFALVAGWNEVYANILSTILSVCISYFLNKKFVFAAQRYSFSSFISFAGLTLATGLILQSSIIWCLLAVATNLSSFSEYWLFVPLAKIVAMGTGAIVNYLGYKLIFSKFANITNDATPVA